MDINTPPDTPPDVLAQGLVDLLDVEEIDTDLYRGARQPGGEGRVFGGQVIAQALQAAQRSTDAPKARIRCTPISCGPATRTIRSSTAWCAISRGEASPPAA